MYIGFVNGGFEIWWCEYLWVVTFPGGGFRGPPPRNFVNMKCSRSDSKHVGPILQNFLVKFGTIFCYMNFWKITICYQYMLDTERKLNYAKIVNDAIENVSSIIYIELNRLYLTYRDNECWQLYSLVFVQGGVRGGVRLSPKRGVRPNPPYIRPCVTKDNTSWLFHISIYHGTCWVYKLNYFA